MSFTNPLKRKLKMRNLKNYFTQIFEIFPITVLDLESQVLNFQVWET